MNVVVGLAAGASVILSGSETYTGTTTIDSGTLQIGNGGSGGSIAGGIVDNGTLIYDRSGPLSFPTALSGSGQLVVAGTGTLLLTGTTSFSGALNVTAGSLLLAGSNAAANYTLDVDVPGGFEFSSSIGGFTVGGLSGSQSFALNDLGNKPVALTVNPENSTTFSGNISGSGSLTETGAGLFVLAGSNSYSGGTSVERGTLVASNPEAIYNGTNLSVGNPTLLARFGNVVPAQTVPSVNVAGMPADVRTVPEPSTWALLMASVALLAMYRKRR